MIKRVFKVTVVTSSSFILEDNGILNGVDFKVLASSPTPCSQIDTVLYPDIFQSDSPLPQHKIIAIFFFLCFDKIL